jgi:hypothetical protein
LGALDHWGIREGETHETIAPVFAWFAHRGGHIPVLHPGVHLERVPTGGVDGRGRWPGSALGFLVGYILRRWGLRDG